MACWRCESGVEIEREEGQQGNSLIEHRAAGYCEALPAQSVMLRRGLGGRGWGGVGRGPSARPSTHSLRCAYHCGWLCMFGDVHCHIQALLIFSQMHHPRQCKCSSRERAQQAAWQTPPQPLMFCIRAHSLRTGAVLPPRGVVGGCVQICQPANVILACG